MIFITTGSQKFQFDRLLKKVDELIEEGIIEDKVFAQTGYCTYVPRNIECQQFLDRETFRQKMEECSMVITHGGTGAIITAVKQGKKVIAVPRLAKYGEHVDDHQVQLLTQFDEMKLICSCYDLDKLEDCYKETLDQELSAYQSNTRMIIDSIGDFLERDELEHNEIKSYSDSEEKKRITYLDAAKGIAILLVCIGHAVSNAENLINIEMSRLLTWISQFHMPLFFMINGMLFRDKYIKNPIRSSVHKVKAYYIPFVVYNMVFLVLHNFFARLYLVNEKHHGGSYSLEEYIGRFFDILTGHRQSFGGATWFLGSLLIISVLFIWIKYIVTRVFSKKSQEWVVAIVVFICVMIGASPQCPEAFKLNVTMYSMLFFYLGYLYKKFDVNRYVRRWKNVMVPIALVGSCLIAFTSYVGIESIRYRNNLLYAVAAILGCVVVLGIAQFKCVEQLKILHKLGKKSLDIMALHFLAFKIVSILIIVLYKLPIERLAEYPVIVGIGGVWWIIYTIVGASVPCLIRELFDKLVLKIKRGLRVNE